MFSRSQYIIFPLITVGFILLTFTFEERHFFEYPSCRGGYEFRLWGITLCRQKHETHLSSYLKANKIEIHTQENMIFPISEKTISLLGGCERRTGGVGRDLAKLNDAIFRQAPRLKKEDVSHILNALQQGNTPEFQRGVWKLYYGDDVLATEGTLGK